MLRLGPVALEKLAEERFALAGKVSGPNAFPDESTVGPQRPPSLNQSAGNEAGVFETG